MDGMERKKQKLTRREFIRDITALIAFIMLVASVSSYLVFRNEYTQWVQAEARNDLETGGRAAADLNTTMSALCMELLSSDISLELLDPDVSPIQELTVLNALRGYRGVFPEIQSIALYAPASRRFYTHSDFASNFVITYEDSYDIDLISAIRGGAGLSAGRPVPIARTMTYRKRGGKDTDVESADVLTWVYSGYDSVDPSRDRFCILNVSTDALTEKIDAALGASPLSSQGVYQKQDTMVIRPDGFVVAGNRDYPAFTRLGQASWASKLAASRAPAGSFRASVGREPSLVIYTGLGIADWRLVRLIPVRSIYHRFEITSGRIIAMLALLSLVALAVSGPVSRWLYSRFGKLAAVVSQLQKENALYSESYEARVRAEILRGEFDPGDRESARVIERLGLARLNGREAVLVMFAFQPAHDPAGLVPRIRSILGTGGALLMDATTEDGYVAVLFDGENGTGVTDSLDLIRSQPEARSTLSIGVSEPGRSIQVLPALYAQAKTALRYSFYEGRGSLCRFASVRNLESGEPPTSEQEQELLRAIKTGDRDEASSCLAAIFGVFRRHAMDVTVRSITKLAHFLRLSLQPLEPGDDGTAAAALDRIMSDPLQYEDIRRLEDALGRTLGSVCDAVSRQRHSRYVEMLTPVETYIQEHYCSASTGLKTIAWKFGLTPSYLEQLFVVHMGVSIPERIKRLRIDQACALLRTTDLPVEEISMRVGHSSVSNFYKIFRRTTGVTPADYRKAG